MMMDRRSFLIGGSALVASAVLPSTAFAVPLVLGIRYQSWPWDAPRPYNDYYVGTIGGYGGELKPLSYFMKALARHQSFDPDLVWEPIFPSPPDTRGAER